MLNLIHILRQALARGEPDPDPALEADPFSDPTIAAMSPAALADLPLSHPPAPPPLPRAAPAAAPHGTRTSLPRASRLAIRPSASAACVSG
ncbi:hypothetical protein GCM10011322_29470 [Salinarimonas ramus]|uniref:Uncharacterized protein n=1 Tax=Salinarimonas ramus TaxID=690164 RepID=A0A917QBF2_9HYPH|nr:hypothetical protein GCM10011322_29470 [Salinarimonas ramus]